MAKRRRKKIIEEDDAIASLYRGSVRGGPVIRRSNWSDVLKHRRDTRLFFTGQFRAPSVIQAAGMVFFGVTGLTLFATFLASALRPSFNQSPPPAIAAMVYGIIACGLVGISSLVNGIASFIERSWRFSYDNFPDKADPDELNVYAALFMGQWETRKPLFIFAQIAVGLTFIFPMLLTISEYVRGLPLSISPEIADSDHLLLLLILLIIPLFIIGGMLLMNAGLNIWRLTREDSKRRDRD